MYARESTSPKSNVFFQKSRVVVQGSSRCGRTKLFRTALYTTVLVRLHINYLESNQGPRDNISFQDGRDHHCATCTCMRAPRGSSVADYTPAWDIFWWRRWASRSEDFDVRVQPWARSRGCTYSSRKWRPLPSRYLFGLCSNVITNPVVYTKLSALPSMHARAPVHGRYILRAFGGWLYREM